MDIRSNTIKREKQIIMKFRLTPLTVVIKGGNRMHGYKNPLELKSVAKHLDEKPPD